MSAEHVGDERAARGAEPDAFRLLVDSLRDHAVFLLEPDGRIATWNPGAERLHGWRSDEIVGRHLSVLHPPEKAGAAVEALRRAEREGGFEDEGWRVVEDGTRFLANVVIACLRDGAGNVRGFGVVERDVTRRFTSADARFHELIEHTPAGVAVLDRDMRYLAVSRRWLEDFRTRERDVIGKSHYEVFPEIPERWKEIHRRCLAGAVERSEEDSFPRADGSVDWIKWEVRPWHDERGEIGGIIIYSEIITARKRAELSLRESEARFRTLANNIPQLAWMADETGWIFWYNQRWYSYTGTTFESMEGWGWRSVHHPDHVQRVIDSYTRALAGGEGWEDTFPLRGSDGLYRWFLSRAYPIRDESGKVVRWFGTSTDVTREKEAQESLERSRRELSFLAEASKALASSLDYESTLSTVSRLAVPTICDWCVIDLVEKDGSLRRLVRAHADPGKMELATKLQAGYSARSDAVQGPIEVLRTGRSVVVSKIPDDWLVEHATDEEHLALLRSLGLGSYLCVPLPLRERVVGVLTLVAESGRLGDEDVPLAEELARRMATAIENARLYREAQQAVRTRDVFLSIASHELKTPLTPLLLQLQSIERTIVREGAPRRLLEKLARAERQGEHLVRLVNGLLDVSRLTDDRLALELERVDLAKVVADVVDRLRPELDAARCQVSVKLEGDATGTWDRLRVEQVAINLLENALKYGPAKPIEVRVSADDRDAWLVVRDEGIGISPADQSRIFERFERAVSDENYGGFGLGLWIAREVVRAMNGEIRVESEPGKGATFTVRLPRARERRAA